MRGRPTTRRGFLNGNRDRPPTQWIRSGQNDRGSYRPRIERTAQLLTWELTSIFSARLQPVGGVLPLQRAANGTRATHPGDDASCFCAASLLKAYLTKSVRIERRSGALAGIRFRASGLMPSRPGMRCTSGSRFGRQRASAKTRNLAWGLGGALVLTRIVLLAHWFSDVAGPRLGSVTERLISS